jgi:hypothetical protein
LTSTFLLFDIDGVLIEPKGYRKAVYDSIIYFLHEIGEEKISINEEIFTSFEAIGITSEWDMIPLFILCVIENSLDYNHPDKSITDIQGLTQFLQNKKHLPNNDDFISLINKFQLYLSDGYSPSESIFKQFYIEENGKPFENIFLYTPWVVKDWIGNSRDFGKSIPLRYFQNLTLGSQLFQEISSLEPTIDTESYLSMYDRPLINNETHKMIKDYARKDDFYISMMTARPSKNPGHEETIDVMSCFPEAELAMQCLNMDDLACVGFGAMQYIGKLKGLSGDNFVKPSPVHAMTAILHAGGINISEALLDAYEYLFNIKRNKVLEFFHKLSSPIEIFIFEDSIIGIQSLLKVHDALKSDGINIKFTAFGISTEINKIKALEKENASIFPTINEAFSTCVERYFKF